MNLGFYYHILVYTNGKEIYLPSYLGIFVDELAKNVNKLYYFAFTKTVKTNEHNYQLRNKNIVLIDLKNKPSFPYLVLFGGALLKKEIFKLNDCDKFLVRAPSPLAPHFYSLLRNKVAYLMVGDYLSFIIHQKQFILKKAIVYPFFLINDYYQKRAIKNSKVFVNSRLLKDKYFRINPNIIEVKTTTVSISNLFYKDILTFKNKRINLLFVGNIDRTKGLEELSNVFIKLRNKGYNVFLNLAGWDTPQSRYYINKLIAATNSDFVIYHGFKNNNELLELYRSNDIFILPSYEEGFPRVIWEAMSNSIPVISTSVGSIPYFLTNEEQILIVPPKNEIELFNAIVRLIQNDELRSHLVRNSLKYVENVTVEKQTKFLIEQL